MMYFKVVSVLEADKNLKLLQFFQSKSWPSIWSYKEAQKIIFKTETTFFLLIESH